MWRRLLVAAVLCAAGGPALAQPSKQQQAQARDHFKRAQAAEKDGRYRDAIDEYQKAYALVPHADVLFNIAFDYEKLELWAEAANFYQRYLDERTEPPADANEVRTKIRDLRAKARSTHADEPPPSVPMTTEPEPPPALPPTKPPVIDSPPVIDQPPETTGPTETPPPPRWHAGFSYGYGFGDAPSERYLGHIGMRLANVVELDGIIGVFGNNDYAAGLLARFVMTPSAGWAPFVRGAATIGYARQDGSSTAGKRYPIGVEAGGGVQFGRRGRFEVDAVVRWLRGGWEAGETTADSYVNDAVTFAIDLGLSFDIPIITTGR
jgi:hypothetical protein